MEKIYVEQHDGGYWVSETRVSLDSVIFAFLQGLSPETIAAECFPILTLEQVYGAVAYYLENQQMVNEYIVEGQRELERMVPPLSQSNPELFARLESAREKAGSKRP